MSRQPKYRGKHPTRIRTVSGNGGGVLVVTNEGARYLIAPLNRVGAANIPICGVDIETYQALPLTYRVEKQ